MSSSRSRPPPICFDEQGHLINADIERELVNAVARLAEEIEAEAPVGIK